MTCTRPVWQHTWITITSLLRQFSSSLNAYYVLKNVCMYVCMHVFTNVGILLHTDTNIAWVHCLYVCMYVCMYVCITVGHKRERECKEVCNRYMCMYILAYIHLRQRRPRGQYRIGVAETRIVPAPQYLPGPIDWTRPWCPRRRSPARGERAAWSARRRTWPPSPYE